MPIQISISNAIGARPTSGGGFTNTLSMSLDGIDDYFLGVGNYNELNGVSIATFSFWLKPQDNGFRILLHVPKNNTNANGQFLIYQRDGRIQMNIDTASYYCQTPDNTLILNQWQHIMICMNLPLTGPEGIIFINGVDQTSIENWATRTALPTSTGGLYIGESNNGYLSPFYGGIDEVAIWSGTDLRNDIATIYNNGEPTDLNNNGLTPPTTWQRMGDSATWNGATWTMTDVNGGYVNTSVNMAEASRVLDVPPNPFANTKSILLDGIDDYFLGASTYSELDGQTKMTFSCWIKPTSATTSVIASIKDSGSTEQFRVIFHSSRYIIIRTYTGSGRDTQTANSSITLNVWTHISFCLDLSLSSGSRGKIFINGVDATSADSMNQLSINTSGGGLRIGARDVGSLLPFPGLIDELAIWSGTDQRANVSEIYGGGEAVDLNNLATAPQPTTWQRMGDSATWNGSVWTMTDVNGGYVNTSANMAEASRTTDVPT
jgi:hypothetical protein